MNYKPKHQVKVDGKMSEKGFDIAGLIVAAGVALFCLLSGVALIVYAGQ